MQITNCYLFPLWMCLHYLMEIECALMYKMRCSYHMKMCSSETLHNITKKVIDLQSNEILDLTKTLHDLQFKIKCYHHFSYINWFWAKPIAKRFSFTFSIIGGGPQINVFNSDRSRNSTALFKSSCVICPSARVNRISEDIH